MQAIEANLEELPRQYSICNMNPSPTAYAGYAKDPRYYYSEISHSELSCKGLVEQELEWLF